MMITSGLWPGFCFAVVRPLFDDVIAVGLQVGSFGRYWR